MDYIKFVFLLCLSICQLNLTAQFIDHWETIVYADDIWTYQPGDSEPNSLWNTNGFDDSAWSNGIGGFGYGDGDDGTSISPAWSVYSRKTFTLTDTSLLSGLILHADYDDAFVAYLNGVEIARSNIGDPGDFEPFDSPSDGFREAVLYMGGTPDIYFISKSIIQSLLQNGSNTLAVQVHNEDISSSDMSSLFWLSAGISDNSVLFGPTPSWFGTPNFTSNILTLSIQTRGEEIVAEPKVIVQIGIADQAINTAFGPFEVYEGFAGIEIRGSSSATFEKKGYALEFIDSTGASLNVPIPGFPSDDDWILHGPYSDKSLIRNEMAFHIARQIEPWAPKTRFCEFWIDGDYLGVYLLIEKIKVNNDRVDIANLLPGDITGDELTGGYIIAVDRDEGPDKGWYSPYMDASHYFEFKDPRGEELNAIQKDYIEDYVTNFEDALAGPNFLDPDLGYQTFVDMASFVDHLIIRELANDVDAYRLSTFLHKDKNSNGGKLKMGPLWDSNLSFGNVDYCTNNAFTAGWAFDSDDACGAPQPFWWDQLLLDTNFLNTWQCRWTELREGPLKDGAISATVDSLQDLLGLAAINNFERWDILGNYVWPNFFVGASWNEEINWLENWIIDRMSWMDFNTPGICRVIEDTMVNGLNFEPLFSVSISPNPYINQLQFSDLPQSGGLIRIYTVNGQELIQYKFAQGISQWNYDITYRGVIVAIVSDDNGKTYREVLIGSE